MQIDYTSLSNSGTKSEKSKVGYFSLKDDGDEAIVRFAYEEPKNFDVVTVHRVKIGDYWRNISCLRNGPKDDVSKCPFCALGDKDKDTSKVSYRFFVKLVEYVKDENGNIKPVAKVWSRPVGFAKELKAYFDDYGPLSDVVFKIKRNGAKGDKETTYNLIYANPAVYKPEVYVKDFSGFGNDFKLEHHSYMIKSKADIEHFLHNGEFPNMKKKEPKVDNNVTKEVAQTEAIKEAKAKVEFDSTPFDGGNDNPF